MSDDETGSEHNANSNDFPYVESKDSLTWSPQDMDDESEEGILGGRTRSQNILPMPASTTNATE